MADNGSRDLTRRGLLRGVAGAGVGGLVAQTARASGRPERMIVGADSDASLAYVEEQVKTLYPGADTVDRDETLEFLVAEVPAAKTDRFESDLGATDVVEYVERDEVMSIDVVEPRDERRPTAERVTGVSDPLLSDEQWAPQEVSAPAAWEETLGSDDVTLAVVDTGIDYEHEDLRDRFGDQKGRDVIEGTDDPMTRGAYHATHVAGIAAGTTDNATGIAGLANVRLLGVRVLGADGTGSLSDVASGIRWAADNGADVINVSLGPTYCQDEHPETITNAVTHALDAGAVVVGAAGNESCENEVVGPGSVQGALSVTALRQVDDRVGLADFSNAGPGAGLTAPGNSVHSTVPPDIEQPWFMDGRYDSLSGTSMAAPVVSGVAALALSVDPDLGVDDLRSTLQDNAVDVGLAADEQGAGRVDAEAVVATLTADRVTARATASDPTPNVDQTVALDAAKSSADATIERHEWDLGDGTTATGQSVRHSYDAAGDYTVSLTVEDDQGRTDTATLTLSVTDNAAPDAGIFQLGGLTVRPGEPVYLGDSSSDPDGEVVAREWSMGDGTTKRGTTVEHTYDAVGEYTVTLTVEDDQGATATATETVTVEGDNEPPTASLSAPDGPLRPGEPYTFDAAGSSDPDGSIRAYDWHFGDGTDATGETVEHAFQQAGDYTVSVTVTDDGGATASASASVRVREDSGPTASIETPDEVYAGPRTVFTAAGSSAADGSIERYEWTGPDGGHGTGMFFVFSVHDPGEFTVELTVTDDDGATDTATVTPTARCHPKDLDCDGAWEDLDGDGELDYDDVVDAIVEYNDDSPGDARYDYDGDGDDTGPDYDDIVTLIAEYNE